MSKHAGPSARKIARETARRERREADVLEQIERRRRAADNPPRDAALHDDERPDA